MRQSSILARTQPQTTQTLVIPKCPGCRWCTCDFAIISADQQILSTSSTYLDAMNSGGSNGGCLTWPSLWLASDNTPCKISWPQPNSVVPPIFGNHCSQCKHLSFSSSIVYIQSLSSWGHSTRFQPPSRILKPGLATFSKDFHLTQRATKGNGPLILKIKRNSRKRPSQRCPNLPQCLHLK